MTVKECMLVTGLSRKTVTEKIKAMYPEIVTPGKTIVLTEEQAMSVVGDLRKKGFVTPAQNSHVPAQNLQVDIKSIVKEVVKELLPMFLSLSKHPATVEQLPEPEYYEVLGYSLKKGLKLSDGEISVLGKLAKKISNERGITVRKNPHPRWGEVGCYHVSVLEEVFRDDF